MWQDTDGVLAGLVSCFVCSADWRDGVSRQDWVVLCMFRLQRAESPGLAVSVRVGLLCWLLSRKCQLSAR